MRLLERNICANARAHSGLVEHNICANASLQLVHIQASMKLLKRNICANARLRLEHSGKHETRRA